MTLHRRGGQEIEAERWPRPVGGHLALDFVNTDVVAQGDRSLDVLRSGDEFRAWCASAGIASAAVAIGPPAAERRNLRDAARLRSALRSAVESLSEAHAPDPTALTTIHAAWTEAMTHAAPSVDGGGVTWTWDPDSPRTLIRQLAWASLELLSAAPIDRIKMCPACGFAFLDTTKNRTRRWCSMADCGTREKARRYVAKRAGRPSPDVP